MARRTVPGRGWKFPLPSQGMKGEGVRPNRRETMPTNGDISPLPRPFVTREEPSRTILRRHTKAIERLTQP